MLGKSILRQNSQTAESAILIRQGQATGMQRELNSRVTENFQSQFSSSILLSDIISALLSVKRIV